MCTLQGACYSYRTLSDEHIIGTPSGTQTCRTIRRRVLTDRWDKDALTVMSGPPWDTKFGNGRPRSHYWYLDISLHSLVWHLFLKNLLWNQTTNGLDDRELLQKIGGQTFTFDITSFILARACRGAWWLRRKNGKTNGPRTVEAQMFAGIFSRSSMASALHRRAGRRGLLTCAKQDAYGSIRGSTVAFSR